MSIIKDGDTGRWTSQIRVTDWTGKTTHKKKRYLATKKETLQWERDFTSQSTGSFDMTFGDLIALYAKGMKHCLRPPTTASKKWLVDLKVTPFFKRIPPSEIKPTHVCQRQNPLTGYRDENGKPYARTYLKCINNQLTAIFNYVVKYYGLREDLCRKAESMSKKHANEMLFQTKWGFQALTEVMKDRPASYMVFMTMRYTGTREGELLALAPSDVDFEKKTLTANKNYQRLGREDVITTPKTPKSIRTILTPDGLYTCLQEYMLHCYGLQRDDRLFPYTKSFLYHEMEYGCKASDVKQIRMYDTRHSHAGLLVETGLSPLLIVERLGCGKVQTAMDTYSRLYPNKQVEVAEQPDGIMSRVSGHKNCCRCSQFVTTKKEKS